MNTTLLSKSRLLLMPEEAQLARPQGERPKVRRYYLARLPVNTSGAVLASDFERQQSAGD